MAALLQSVEAAEDVVAFDVGDPQVVAVACDQFAGRVGQPDRPRRGIQFETFSSERPLFIPETGKFTGTRVTVLLEVTGAAHYLPAYAGNLDIMTSAAKATAERIASHSTETAGAAS
jgi:acetaldehyde dehydrogenase